MQGSGLQARMIPLGYISMGGYTIGLPLLFTFILIKHRREIYADQCLRALQTGHSPTNNPQYRVRRRYQELYSLFRPELFAWRLVLTLRKFSIVSVALMFSSNPLFQAWYVLNVMQHHDDSSESFKFSCTGIRLVKLGCSHSGSA